MTLIIIRNNELLLLSPQTMLHHRSSLEALTNWNWKESRVLIIYTGGTIGMTMNKRGSQ